MVKCRILVIVVTYNAMSWAERCFNSLKVLSVSHDVFIVDNGSSDGTQQYIREKFPEFIFCQSETNLGFGRANNIGLEYAIEHGYDYVYLLNQDAWIFPDTLSQLIEAHQKNPQYGILSPMQMSAEMNDLDKGFCDRTCKGLTVLTEDLYFGRSQDVYTVEWVMAAHWLISIDCLRKVGGFSPTFQQYGEDDNFIDRVHYHGLMVGIVPAAKAVHDRKYREQTRAQFLFHHFYKYYLVLFSQPRKIRLSEWMKMIYSNILSALNNRSVTIIKYTFQLLMKSKQIRSNRLRSKQSGAFIS